MLKGMVVRCSGLLACACVWAIPEAADARKFTNKNGTVMEAELISHKGGKVTIRRDDGKEFEVDPSIFSVTDEQFVRTWMATRPELIEYKFDVVTEKKVANRRSSTTSSTTDWTYEIRITNRSQDTIPYFKVRYRVLYSTSSPRMLEGEIELTEPLECHRTLIAATKPVTLYKYRDSYHGKTERYGDLKGCLVQVLDREGKVLVDTKSTEIVMKHVTWENSGPRHGARSHRAVIR